MNHGIVDMQTFKFAVYGGNIEIVQIVEKKLNKNDFEIEKDHVNNNNKNRLKKNYFGVGNCLFNYKNRNWLDDYNNDVSNFIDEVVYNDHLAYIIVPSFIKHQNDLFDWMLEKNLAKNTIKKDSFTDLILISCECGNAYSIVELFDKYFEYTNAIFSNNLLIERIIETICNNGFYLMMKIVLNLFEKLISEDQNFLLLPDGKTTRKKIAAVEYFFSEDPLKLSFLYVEIPKIYTVFFGNLSILRI